MNNGSDSEDSPAQTAIDNQTIINNDVTKHKLDVKFTGTTREYFGIWITNTLLSIITLGIYSAWAKVRRKRYFNGNTWIDNYNFEYHANPLTILKGRIIVFSLLIAYNIMVNLAPLIGLGFFLLLIAALPWFINKGLSFNARMTSYRNVRFSFKGSYWRCLWVMIILPILCILPFGLLIPFSTRLAAHYYYSNHRFGNADFYTDPPLKALYANFFRAMIVAISAIITTFNIFLSVMMLFEPDFIENMSDFENFDPVIFIIYQLPLIIIAYTILIAIYLVPYLYYNARSYNTSINNLTLDQKHSFSANVEGLKYSWIIISNLLVTVCTLGLMAPWAHIRKTKYLANHVFILPSGSLDEFINVEHKEGNAAASEYMDVDGIDFGL